MHHQAVPLIATRSTVRFAREVASHIITQWELGHLADPVTLIVSELVTNTVNALGLLQGDLRPWEVQHHHVIHLLLCHKDTVLLVGVHDRLSGMPQSQNANEHAAEHGRGLFLVEAMSDTWGVAPTQEGGKIVWSRLDTAGANPLEMDVTVTQPLPAVSAPLPRRQPGATTGAQAAFAFPAVDPANLQRILDGLSRL